MTYQKRENRNKSRLINKYLLEGLHSNRSRYIDPDLLGSKEHY